MRAKGAYSPLWLSFYVFLFFSPLLLRPAGREDAGVLAVEPQAVVVIRPNGAVGIPIAKFPRAGSRKESAGVNGNTRTERELSLIHI